MEQPALDVEDDVSTEPLPEEGGGWTLDEVLVEAKTWKTRLAQADRWLERLSGDQDDDCVTLPCGSKEQPEARAERIVRESGWFAVESERLARVAPAFRVSELAVEGIAAEWLPGAIFDLRGTELSTAPWLVDGPPTISLTSRDGTVAFAANLAPASRGGGLGGLRFHWLGMDVDEAMSLLSLEEDAPLRGGTLDLELEGAWANGEIGALDLPISVTFRGSTLVIPGVEEVVLDEFVVPVRLAGTLRAPVVHFETKEFTDALVAAGREQLAGRVRDELEERLGDEVDGALDKLKESTGVDVPGGLEGVLGDKKDDVLKGAFGGFRRKR